MKHGGGSIMLWGWFSGKVPGALQKIDGREWEENKTGESSRNSYATSRHQPESSNSVATESSSRTMILSVHPKL